MGEVLKVACASCGAKWQRDTGYGLMHGELRRVIEEFPEEIQKEIESCEGTDGFPIFEFAYRLSVCGHCGSIESVPVLRFMDSGRQYQGLCAACGQETRLAGDIKQTPCPVCHKEALTAEEIGTWD